ncbi:MAG: PsiF family protein [Zoogloeaceae bacterium]|jgi:hypothetical protein|nr:PsiF family protein [Zoogloeaceae bacterium]
MKKTLFSLCAALSLAFASAGLVQAADNAAPKKEPTPAQKAQREKMKTCNQEAKTQALKGDARKAFMKECLSSGSSPNKADDPSKG